MNMNAIGGTRRTRIAPYIAIAATVVALGAEPPVLAGTYVVSPVGSDDAAGTANAPFRTLGKAAQVMKAGDVCRVRAGTYRETVRPAESGHPDAPLVFENWPNERPRLTGCDPVTGWTRVTGNVWRAAIAWDMGKHNQVFVDGTPATEARWPNKTKADPLDWEGVPYDKGSCNAYLLCKALPPRPDGYWKGATLWVMAGAKWTSWSTVVTNSTDNGRKLFFALPYKHGAVGVHMSPADRRGGFFYLVGARGELDAPYEWFLDGHRRMLYLCVADGEDPNSLRIEARRRQLAFDLSKRRHVNISGFDLLGASLALHDAQHCTVRDVCARWISHTRGGNTGYSLGEELGIGIGGHDNTIRDSEIAGSAGNGIRLSGERNAVINCWIHDTDYTGSYDAPIKVWGSEMLISHNTIHDTGRDCIQPSGQGHIIEYNNIYRMGRLAHDLGATYACATDGGNTEFRYNWCHDNVAHGTRMGIYLDNFTSFYFVHHNVVWGIGGCDIRLNKPALHNIVVNNTMMGETGNWGRWPTDWMYGCAYVNNAVTGAIKTHPQAASAANTFHIPPATLNPTNFSTYTAGAGRGIRLTGLTPDAPAIGAYEPGASWRAGHDFANPPETSYRPSDTPLRNLVQHGSFDWIRWRGTLGPWTPTGARTAAVVRGGGGIETCYTKRDTIINAGVRLNAKDGDDGIAQRIVGLRPGQPYELGAWVKVVPDTSTPPAITLSLGTGDTTLVACRADATSGAWQRLMARFTADTPAPAEATIHLTKHGPGTVFADDISLVGLVPGLEPQAPGFAPTAQ